MRIQNRLFPYPILNQNKYESNFNDLSYNLSYEEEKTDQYLNLYNVRITTTSQFISDLLKEGKAKAVCVIEAPLAMYRETFEIGESPIDKKIRIFDLVGKAEISSFIYAVEDINDYKSMEFEEDYQNIDFFIEKYSIIAIDNGYTLRLNFDEEKENKYDSVFVFIANPEETPLLKWDSSGDYIEIYLPSLEKNYYEAIKQLPEYNNIIMSIYVVPVLTMSLYELKEKNMPLKDLEFAHRWFSVFLKSYEDINKSKLTDEGFSNMDLNDLSVIVQNIFKQCCVLSIDDLYNISDRNYGDDDDE